NGLNDAGALAYSGGSNHISRLGQRLYEDANTEKGIIMTSAEHQFILAEAAEQDRISSDAVVHYLNGIEASLSYYGIEADTVYFEQESVAFDPAQALQKIAVQKWIALFFNGYEAWFDLRRTKMPVLPPVDGSDRIMSRWEYPGEEQS